MGQLLVKMQPVVRFKSPYLSLLFKAFLRLLLRSTVGKKPNSVRNLSLFNNGPWPKIVALRVSTGAYYPLFKLRF